MIKKVWLQGWSLIAINSMAPRHSASCICIKQARQVETKAQGAKVKIGVSKATCIKQGNGTMAIKIIKQFQQQPLRRAPLEQLRRAPLDKARQN